MATIEELSAIEQQLACPFGEQGLKIAAMMHETNQSMTLAAWQLLRLPPNARVLELGHGNAAHVSAFLNARKDVHYTGLEISELMYEEAKRLNHNMVNHYRAEFALYEGETLPSFIQAFDGIFTVNTVYFWQHPSDLLRQIRQQLSPLGRLVIGYMSADFLASLPFVAQRFQPYQIQTLETLLSAANFQNIRTETLCDDVVQKDGRIVKRTFHITVASL